MLPNLILGVAPGVGGSTIGRLITKLGVIFIVTAPSAAIGMTYVPGVDAFCTLRGLSGDMGAEGKVMLRVW